MVDPEDSTARSKEQVRSVIHNYPATVRYDFTALLLQRDATAEDVAQMADDLPVQMGDIHGTQEHTVAIDIDGFEKPIQCSGCKEPASQRTDGEWLCERHVTRYDLIEQGFSGDLLTELVERELA